MRARSVPLPLVPKPYCARISGSLHAEVVVNRDRERAGLLANQEHIYGAEIEVVVERQRGEAIVGWMLSCIELSRVSGTFRHWLRFRRLTMTVLPLYWMM
jgi:hypothetical protein